MIDLNSKIVFTTDEVAQYTGLSKSAIYKLTMKKILPSSKPGGKVMFFLKADVDKFLMTNREQVPA